MSNLINPEYFKTWKSMLDIDIQEEFSVIQKMELEPHSFTFYTSVSVMSSSKIEGEQMEVDSYVKHKVLNIEYLPELTEKPNDLYKAYLFARDNKLTQGNFLQAHLLIAAHLLPKNQQGIIRTSEMVVLEHKTGRIQYEAAPAAIVKERYNLLWKEIEMLLNKTLTIEEIFYYAAFIHLAFVNIHPFGDGNGRISRLLEKWFLAEKLGERAWYIKSEKYYYKHVNDYYRNLARLGLFYERLEYEKSIPFLLMLPQSLIFEK
ncbi:MAG: Fic family protein [Verrucomicrobia bacterium]|nr:Fic family protein [Verrucomicrobiota bacterium]